jgi:hypothetical protein
MAAALIIAFLVVVAATVAGGRLAVSGHGHQAADAEASGGVRRRTTMLRWSGVGAGVTAAVGAAFAGALGRGLILAAPLFGLFVVAGVLAGELSVRAPVGKTRRAAVAARRVTDYLPRGLACAVACAVVMLVALLCVTTAMGSADVMGRAGRVLVRQCNAALMEGHGPWAGSFYSIPLGVVILVGLTAAAIALLQVVRRPRPGDPADLRAVDDQLRRRAARAITGACGVLVTVPLIGVSLVTAEGFVAIACRPTWWTGAAWTLLALVPGWIAVLAWSGLAVLAPQRWAPASGGG